MIIIAFDLDDVLCYRENKYELLGLEKYKYCLPIYENINIMNACYEKGYYIKIYTFLSLLNIYTIYLYIGISIYAERYRNANKKKKNIIRIL